MSTQILTMDVRLLVGVGILALLVGLIVIRRLNKVERKDEALANVFTIAGLGWSSEAMWEIARQDIGLDVPYTVFLFLVFEMALIVSMIRAKRHMIEHQWPGRYGRTVWGLALFMGLLAASISDSVPEALVRLAVPIAVAKLWWDGVVGGAQKPEREESEWTITVDKTLRWLRLKKPKAADRDRLVAQMTDLAFSIQYLQPRRGFGWRTGRRTMRLMSLSLTADADVIAEVRRRVAQANWFTVTPLTQAMTQPVTHVLTQADDAPATRAKGVLTSSDADPATQAAQLYLLGEYDSIRAAADAVLGASEATVRRRLKDMGDAPVTHLNGHRPKISAS